MFRVDITDNALDRADALAEPEVVVRFNACRISVIVNQIEELVSFAPDGANIHQPVKGIFKHIRPVVFLLIPSDTGRIPLGRGSEGWHPYLLICIGGSQQHHRIISDNVNHHVLESELRLIVKRLDCLETLFLIIGCIDGGIAKV